MFFLFKFDCMCPCLDVEKQKHQSGKFHRFFLVIPQMEILDICLACLIDFLWKQPIYGPCPMQIPWQKNKEIIEINILIIGIWTKLNAVLVVGPFNCVLVASFFWFLLFGQQCNISFYFGNPPKQIYQFLMPSIFCSNWSEISFKSVVSKVTLPKTRKPHIRRASCCICFVMANMVNMVRSFRVSHNMGVTTNWLSKLSEPTRKIVFAKRVF